MSGKKHTSLELEEDIWKDLKMKSIEEGKGIGDLIRKAIYDYYGYGQEKPKEDQGSDQEEKKEKIEISDLDKSIIDLSKKLEGGNVGSDQTIRNITLSCLRYLKNHKEATHKNFKNDVYPKYQEDFKEDSFWKVAKNGLKQIEGLGDVVKTPKGRGHYKYKWKE